MKNPRALAVAPLFLILALLAASCVSTENPQGWAAPVFDANSVFFLQAKDRLAAAPTSNDPNTTISWSFPDKNNPADKDVKLQAVYGDPVIDGDRLYFSSYSGGVFALNKADGRPTWRMNANEIQGNAVSGVAVSGDLLAFGTTDGRLYVLNKADKSPAKGWPKAGISYNDGIWAAPVIKGDTIYVATMGGEVHALDVANAAERWSRPFRAPGAIAALSILNDDTLFVPGLNKHVYLLNPADGSVKSDFRTDDWVWTLPAFDKDRNLAYFGDFSGKLYALDITTGKEAWSSPLDAARIKSAPVVVNNVLVVGDRKPAIHFLDLKDNGKRLNQVPLTSLGSIQAPIGAHDGAAYISTTSGKLLRADPTNYSVTEVTVGGRQ